MSDVRFQVLIAVARNIGILFSGIGRHVVYITNVSRNILPPTSGFGTIKERRMLLNILPRAPPGTTTSQWPGSKTANFAVLAP